MKGRFLIISLILIDLISFSLGQYGGYNDDAVLLENIKSLTFVRRKMTAGRRSAPMNQLNCIGGNACGRYELQPSTVQCTNVGSDGFDVNWKCEADLDSSVRFGETIVSCEGYNNPNDPYVLRGSCGLEYSLEFTNQESHHRDYSNYNTSTQHNGINWGNVIMMVIIGIIIYGIWNQYSANRGYTNTDTGNPPPYPGGSFGPSGGYGGNYGNGYGTPYRGGYPDPSNCNPTYPTYPTNNQATYRPGFWTGLGTGGVLGYLFGRPRTYGYGMHSSPTTHRSGWSSSGGRSFGSSTRTATAYASTRRR